ncbi:hypothetical protein, variant 1 [Phialophora macrospora]|uniref:Uncharacterized protein n=2 Tax=Phialophora macrospora TaxID=1851006 RepID=A0A0D2FUY9_9EURO|nr:hypothetical protein, variant 1 [Phialophora macrospora]
MASIQHLLNTDLEDLIINPAFTHDFSDATLEFPRITEDWGAGDWSGELNLEWDGLCHGLFVAGSKQDPEWSPDQLAEATIQTWEADNIPSSHDAVTPSTTVLGESSYELDPAPQVCFGMIYRTAARLSGEMSHLDTKLHSPDARRNHSSHIFSVGRTATHLALYFVDGTEFGILNAQISKALIQVLALPSIEIDVFADVVTVVDTIRRAQKASEATIPVNMNIYGSPDVRQGLDAILSKHKIWLQHPDHRRTGSTYDNPHCITFPGVVLSDTTVEITPNSEAEVVVDEPQRFQQAISEVYASLKRDSHLKTVEADPGLRTPLLLHQKTALDFMLQREMGPIPLEFSLWEPDDAGGGEGFSHVITKAKSRLKPSETGGGILADEMGMGKSLSILALVTKTLDAAQAWQQGSDDALRGLSTERISELTPSRATLVLVPSALLLHEWQAEIQKHVQEDLKVIVYHGKNRSREVSHIPGAYIVLSTYQTIAIESPVATPHIRSPLLDFAWFRIVLDEAHFIRRRTTTFYETVSRLQGKSRWCLSGTPIQNTLDDIGSLFAFIRADPFDKIAVFRHFIARPFDHGQNRKTASRRLSQLIDSTCLRRGRGVLHLPSQNEQVREVEFSSAERAQYQRTKTQMSRLLENQGNYDSRRNTFGQFHVQLQLRILCNHGTFQDPFSWRYRDLQSEREDLYYQRSGQGRNEVKCSLCMQSMPYLSTNQVYRTITGDCAHVLCDECLDLRLEGTPRTAHNTSSLCPICKPLYNGVPTPDSDKAGNRNSRHEQFAPNGQSAKMDALVQDLRLRLQETKSIVFSCWTKTLDLIAQHLQKNNIKWGRIDGESPVSGRKATLDEFETSEDVRVLIMTTGTGAFGLNLAAANRIFIVEPQWNPSIENQAIARALRYGQQDHVQVIRYVVKDTVEMLMRNQQQRKIEMAALADMASNK